MLSSVQKDLKLEDEESAKKVFFSDIFGFPEKREALVKKFSKELQNAIDYYEVQAGLSVDSLIMTSLPQSLNWVRESISSSTDIKLSNIDYGKWLDLKGIDIEQNVNISDLDSRWFNLVGLLASFKEERQVNS